MRASVLLLALLCLPPAAAGAAQDAALDKRAAALEHQLRCLVCQNQTIAESNASLAVDLRNQIHEQLQRGASDQEILDFMVTRYGDFVLYRPPFKATTIALWVGPFVLLALGILVLWRRIAHRRASAPVLSDVERARAAQLLE